VIGFCDRDDSTYTSTDGRECYDYELDGVRVYTLIKTSHGWALEEHYEGEMIRVSNGLELGMTLCHAFLDVGHCVPGQVNIILPVNIEQKEKALALMYYFGGYTGSFVKDIVHKALQSMYPEPGLAFLGFSKVPENIFFGSRITSVTIMSSACTTHLKGMKGKHIRSNFPDMRSRSC
jgi:hypothetical protein